MSVYAHGRVEGNGRDRPFTGTLLSCQGREGRPRERDWLDVEGTLVRLGARLDLRQVKAGLDPLLALKEDVENEPRLWALCQKCGLRVP